MRFNYLHRKIFFLLLFATVPLMNIQGQVKAEKIAYFNQPNCYRLSNNTAEVIFTTDIGPRVIRYAGRTTYSVNFRRRQ